MRCIATGVFVRNVQDVALGKDRMLNVYMEGTHAESNGWHTALCTYLCVQERKKELEREEVSFH